MLTSLGDSENEMKDVYLYYSAMIKKTTFWMKEPLIVIFFLTLFQHPFVPIIL